MILAIDCMGLVWQAHYSLKDLSHKHRPTGIIFGFLGHVLQLAQMFKTRDVVFCWDSRHSFRKQDYPDYKSGRTKDLTPQEKADRAIVFQQAVKLRREILPAMGFNNVCIRRGCEADDLLARVALDTLDDVMIVSSDEDLYQLLGVNTRIYQPGKRRVMTAKRFQQEYGLSSFHWGWIKIVAGCRGDGVPPIAPGIGEKTAIKSRLGLLKANSAKQKAIDKAKNQYPGNFGRNQKLVILPHRKCKRPFVHKADAFDIEGFKEICRQYGMKSMLRRERLEEWVKTFQFNARRST